MKKNPLKDGVISENSAGVGTVTPEMVRARAEVLQPAIHVLAAQRSVELLFKFDLLRGRGGVEAGERRRGRLREDKRGGE